MSFEHIQTLNKWNDLIKRYLKAQEAKKEEVIASKTAKEEFQRDVIQHFTQPIVEAIQELLRGVLPPPYHLYHLRLKEVLMLIWM